MSAPRAPSEQEFHDYVDGRLEPRRRAEIAAYLSRHPGAAAQVESYRAQVAGLHALYDDAIEEPVPPAMLALLRRHEQGRLRRRRMALAAALLLVLAAGLAGWGLGRVFGPAPSAAPALLAAAREAYRLYAPEPRWTSDVVIDTGAAAALRRRLGTPVSLPDPLPSGLVLEAVRILPAATGSAAVLLYREATGGAVSLYVAPVAAADRKVRSAVEGDTVTLYRITGGVFYALTLPRDAVAAVEASFGMKGG